jgi:hypothetical protein
MEISLFANENNPQATGQPNNAASIDTSKVTPEIANLMEKIKDLPQEEQQSILSKVFNPNLESEDIDRVIKSGKPYQFTSPETYTKYKKYKDEEEGHFLRDVATSLGAVPDIIGDAANAYWKKPSETIKKTIPSVVEGLAQNGRDTYGMFWESNDPSSPFFRFKAALNGGGNTALEMYQLNDAIRFQKMSMDLAEGKTTLVMDKDLIDPKVTQLAATLVDPEVFIPYAGPISLASGVARLAGFGEKMTLAAIRAQKIKSGVLGGTLKWGVGAPAEFIGNLAKNSIEHGVRMGAGVLENVAGVSGEDVVRVGRAAGVATASAHVAGYSLPYAGPLAATHLGGGLLGGFGQAVTETGNQILRSQGHRGSLGFARQALEDASKNGINFSSQGKMFARIIDTFDPAMSYAFHAAEGAIAGGVIGAGFAYGSQGADGVGQGVGFGLGAGAVGGLGGRVAAAASGSLRRMRNDIQGHFSVSLIGETDKISANDLVKTKSDPRASVEEIDAVNMTAHALASLEGTVHYRAFGGGIDSAKDFAAWKQSRDGHGISVTNQEFRRIEGFFVQRGNDGALYIGVNLDNLYGTRGRDYAKHTLSHELLHAVLMASAVGPSFQAMGRDMLVGVRNTEGKLVQKGILTRNEFDAFTANYRDAEYGKSQWSKLPDGPEKKALQSEWFKNRELVKSAMDKLETEGQVGSKTNMTPEETNALNKYTEEFLAYYFSGMMGEVTPEFFAKKGAVEGMDAVMDFVKNSWKDHWENRVMFHEPRFSFHKNNGGAIDAGFFDKNGKRVRVGAIDYFLKDMLKASMDIKSKGFIDLTRLTESTRARLLEIGANGVLIKDPKTGKVRPKTRRELASENAFKGSNGHKVLEAMDPALRRSQTGPDGVIRGDFSDAEFDALAQNGILTNNEAQIGKLFQRTKDDPSIPNVFEFGYLGKSKQIEGGADNDRVTGDRVPITNREVLLADFTAEFGADGHFAMRIRGLDMKVMKRRKALIWQNPSVRALWADDHRLLFEDFKAYLSNLSLPHNDANRVKTEVWLNQKYGDGLGDARRDVLHQISGFAKGQDLAYANTPIAIIPRGTLMAVTDFTVDSIMNLRTSGENFGYVHSNAFYDVARNFKPAAFKPHTGVGENEFFRNPFGYNILKSKGVFKVFGQTGEHIGNAENAKKAAALAESHFDTAIPKALQKATNEQNAEIAKFKFKVSDSEKALVRDGKMDIEDISAIKALRNDGTEGGAHYQQELYQEFLLRHTIESQQNPKIWEELLSTLTEPDVFGTTWIRKTKNGFDVFDKNKKVYKSTTLQNRFSKENSKLENRLINHAILMKFLKELSKGDISKPFVINAIHSSASDGIINHGGLQNTKTNTRLTSLALSDGFIGFLGSAKGKSMTLPDGYGGRYGQMSFVAARLENAVLVNLKDEISRFYEVTKTMDDNSLLKLTNKYANNPFGIKSLRDASGRWNFESLDAVDEYIASQYPNRPIIKISREPYFGTKSFGHESAISVLINSNTASDTTVYFGSNFKIEDGVRVPSDEAKSILSKRKGIEYNGFTKKAAEEFALRRVHQKDQIDDEYAPNSSAKLFKPANVDEYFRDSYVKELLEVPSRMSSFEESIFEQARQLVKVSNIMHLGDGAIRNLQAVANLIEAARRDALLAPDLKAMTPDEYAGKLVEIEKQYVSRKIELHRTRIQLYQDYQYADMFKEFTDSASRANLGGLVANGNQDSAMYSHPYLHAAVESGVSNSMLRLSESIRHVMSLTEKVRMLNNELKDVEDMPDSNDRKLKLITKTKESIRNSELAIEIASAQIEMGKEQLSDELKLAKGLSGDRLKSLIKNAFQDENFVQVESIDRMSHWEKTVKQSMSIDNPEQLYYAFWIRTLGFGSSDADIGSSNHAKYKDLFAEAYEFLSTKQERETITAGTELRTAIDWARENASEPFKTVISTGQTIVTDNWSAEKEKRTSIIFTDVTNPFILMHNKIGTDIIDAVAKKSNESYSLYDKSDDAVSALKRPTTYETYIQSLQERIDSALRQSDLSVLDEQLSVARSDARYLDFSEYYINALEDYKGYDHSPDSDPILGDIKIKGKHDLLISEIRDAVRQNAELGTVVASNRLLEVLTKRQDASDDSVRSMLHLSNSAYEVAKGEFSELDMKKMFINVLRDGMIEIFQSSPSGIKAKEILKHIQLLTSKGIPVKSEADAIGFSKHLAELEEARRGKPNEKITIDEVLEYIDANSFYVETVDKIGVLDMDSPSHAGSQTYILGNNASGFGDIVGYGTVAAFVQVPPSVQNPERFYPSQGDRTPHPRPNPERTIAHTRYTFRKNTLDDILAVVEEIQANNAQRYQVESIKEEKMVQGVLGKLDPIVTAAIEKLKASIRTSPDVEFFNMANAVRKMIDASWNSNPAALFHNGLMSSSAKTVAQVGTKTKGPEDTFAKYTARRVLEMQLQHLDSEARLHSDHYETMRDLFVAALSGFEDTGVIPKAAFGSEASRATIVDKYLAKALQDAKGYGRDWQRENFKEAMLQTEDGTEVLLNDSSEKVISATARREAVLKNSIELIRKNVLTPTVTRKIWDTIYSTAIKEIIKTRGSYTTYLNFATEIEHVRGNTEIIGEIEYIVDVAIKMAQDKGKISNLSKDAAQRIAYSLLSSMSEGTRFGEGSVNNYTSAGTYYKIMDNLIQTIAHKMDIDVARAEIKGSLDGTIDYKNSSNGNKEFDAKVLGQPTRIANWSSNNQFEHSHVWDNISISRSSKNYFRAISRAMEAYMGGGELPLGETTSLLESVADSTLFSQGFGAMFSMTDGRTGVMGLSAQPNTFDDSFIRNDAKHLLAFLRYSDVQKGQQVFMGSEFKLQFIQKFAENPRRAYESLFEKVIGPDYKRLIPILLAEKSGYSRRSNGGTYDSAQISKRAEKFRELGLELGIDQQIIGEINGNINSREQGERLDRFESLAEELSTIGVETKAGKDFIKEQIKELFLDTLLSPAAAEKRKKYIELPFQPSSEHRLIGLRMMLRRASLNGAKKVLLVNANLSSAVSNLAHFKGRALYETIDYPLARKEAKRLGLSFSDPEPIATLSEKVLALIPPHTADEIRSMRTVALDSLVSRKNQAKKLVQKFRLDANKKVVADYTPEVLSLIEIYKKRHAEELAKQEAEPSYPVDSSSSYEEMTEPFLYADASNAEYTQTEGGKYTFSSDGDQPLQAIEKRVTDAIGSNTGQDNRNTVARSLEQFTSTSNLLNKRGSVPNHYKGTMRALAFVDRILRIQKKQSVVDLGMATEWMHTVGKLQNSLGRLEDLSGPDRLAFNLKNIEDGILLLQESKKFADAEVVPVLDMAIAWQKELHAVSSYYAKLNDFDNGPNGTSVVKPIDWVGSRTVIIDLENKSEKFIQEIDKGTAFYKPSAGGFGQETNAFHNKMVGNFASQNNKFARGVKLYANVNAERGRANLEVQVFNLNGESIDGVSRSMYSAVIDEKTMAATIFPITDDTDSMHQKLARDETLMRLYAMGVSDIDEPLKRNSNKEPVMIQEEESLNQVTGKNIEKMKPVAGKPIPSIKIKQRNPDYWTSTNTGDGMSLRTHDGYFISLMNNKYRVYNINRELLGIFSDEQEAKRKVEAYKSKYKKQ